MKEFFLDLCPLLKSVDGVNYVHKWNNQLAQILKDGGATSQMFPFPAVFPAFKTSQIVQIGNGVQMYDPFDFDIHILDWQLDTGDGNFEQNLTVYDLRKRIHAKVQKFQPGLANELDPTGSCIRISEQEDNDHPGLYHFVMSYRTTFIDNDLKEPVGGQDIAVALTGEIDLTIQGSQDTNEPYKYTF